MIQNKQEVIVGLDIGTTKVVAIAGVKNEFGKIDIVGFGRADSAGVNHGVVVNIDECVKSIQNAIADCKKSNPNLEIKNVYVGIAGQHIKSLQTRGDRVRFNTDSEITKQDIDLLLKDQYKTYIPAGDRIVDIIPQEYFVDDIQTTTSPVGMNGVKIGANFHIVTGDKNAIKNIKRCIEKAGLEMIDIILQPLASAAAVISDVDLEAGVAIVDIGGGTTDLAVFYDGILKHTAVIPYAGVNVTNDIRTGLGVLRAQAEAMKVIHGSALASSAIDNAYISIPGIKGMPAKQVSVKNLSMIIQARMHEILEQVYFHLKQIGMETRLNGGIILTGGGAQLKNISQLADFVTGLSSRIGDPNEHIGGESSFANAAMNPMYSTCIGLVLRGFDDLENGTLQVINDMGNSYLKNIIKQNQDDVISEVAPTTDIATTVAVDETNSDSKKVSTNPIGNKRKNIFNQFKDIFMTLFEEVQTDAQDEELK